MVTGWGDETPEELARLNAENAPLPFIPTPTPSEAAYDLTDELVVFENADVQQSENLSGGPLMVGPPSNEEVATGSQTHDRPRDLLDTSLMEQALLGLQLQVQQLSEAFTSIQSTLGERIHQSKPPRQKKRNGFEPFTSYGTPSNTQDAQFSYPKKKATGKRSSPASTGTQVPDLGRSKPIPRTRKPWDGMVRSAVIFPTINGSSTLSPRA